MPLRRLLARRFHRVRLKRFLQRRRKPIILIGLGQMAMTTTQGSQEGRQGSRAIWLMGGRGKYFVAVSMKPSSALLL